MRVCAPKTALVHSRLAHGLLIIIAMLFLRNGTGRALKGTSWVLLCKGERIEIQQAWLLVYTFCVY